MKSHTKSFFFLGDMDDCTSLINVPKRQVFQDLVTYTKNYQHCNIFQYQYHNITDINIILLLCNHSSEKQCLPVSKVCYYKFYLKHNYILAINNIILIILLHCTKILNNVAHHCSIELLAISLSFANWIKHDLPWQMSGSTS